MNWITTLILSNLAVASLIAVLAFFVGRSGRRATAAHLLWLTVFVKLITPPILPAPISVPAQWAEVCNRSHNGLATATGLNTAQPQHLLAAPLGSGDLQAAGGVGASGGHLQQAAPALSTADWLVLIWTLGASILVGRGLVRFIRCSRLLQRESFMNPEATSMVRQLVSDGSGQASSARSVFAPEVRLIAARISPMLFGLGKHTCIICPERLWQTLDHSQRRAFLAHETAHFLRRDHWVRWLEWMVTAIYWWFPLIYIAREQLERHEEAACDAWAIARLQTAPRVYAEALLNVVDYLSETKVGVPRLASRMQATATLEERLRLIMSSQSMGPSLPSVRALAFVCLGLTVIHPSLEYSAEAASVSAAQRSLVGDGKTSANGVGEAARLADNELVQDRKTLAALPPVPRGWWNERPAKTWADLRLTDRDLRMIAEAGFGLTVQRGDGSSHSFNSEFIGALAYVRSSGRLIIGNVTGELHLWDVKSSQAVSLIGKHQAAISSIAYHPTAGLVSGDRDGNLISWDLQSGQIMGTASASGPVCSVRWSSAGDSLAVIASDWAAQSEATSLCMFRGRSLDAGPWMTLPLTVALVQQHPRHGWLALDWSGKTLSLESGTVIGHVSKAAVSGMVLCQDLFDSLEQTLTVGNMQ